MNCDVICDSSDPLWIVHRTQGISASNVGTIMGLNEYEKRAYKEILIDLAAAAPLEDNAHMWRGRVMERPIIEKANELGTYPGGIEYHGQLVRSVTRPWALATLDAYCSKTNVVVDVKCPGPYARKKWSTKIPDDYYAQLQWQMYVTEADGGSLLAYFCDRDWPARFDVDRDEEFIARAVDECWIAWREIQVLRAAMEDVRSELTLEGNA